MPHPLPTTLSALEAALREDASGALLIAAVIVALFVASELAGRLLEVPTEWTRKGTHVGAGAVVLAFPWLLEHTVTVALLAVAFAGLLVGGRVTGLLGSIHDVERRTGGAYYYPFAVLAAWILAHGDPMLYCLPLAIMAVADTGAALVGKRAGETTYPVMDGHRSLEGSLAFFTLSFGIVLLGGALFGRPGWPDLLLVTLVVAGLTTSVEAVSVRGSDNLFIPYAAWLGLERTERLGLASLGDWILGMLLGVVVLLITGERAKLSAAGAVVVFLVCTLSFALGGLAWFLPLAVLYGLYLAIRRPGDPTELDMVFPTTAGSMVVLLVYAHTDDPSLFVPFLATVAANGAMAGALIARHRGWLAPLVVLVGAAVPVASAGLIADDAALLLPAAAGIGALLLFAAFSRTPLVGRRLVVSLIAGLVVWWFPLDPPLPWGP